MRPVRRHAGGTIPGQRHPYGDRVKALLAPGEEVISNRYGQADRNRELLKAINANRYAEGGTVGRGVSVAASVNVGEIKIRGTLNTPWGPAQVEGIALAAANRVVNAQIRHEQLMGDRDRPHQRQLCARDPAGV